MRVKHTRMTHLHTKYIHTSRGTKSKFPIYADTYFQAIFDTFSRANYAHAFACKIENICTLEKQVCRHSNTFRHFRNIIRKPHLNLPPTTQPHIKPPANLQIILPSHRRNLSANNSRIIIPLVLSLYHTCAPNPITAVRSPPTLNHRTHSSERSKSPHHGAPLMGTNWPFYTYTI